MGLLNNIPPVLEVNRTGGEIFGLVKNGTAGDNPCLNNDTSDPGGNYWGSLAGNRSDGFLDQNDDSMSSFFRVPIFWGLIFSTIFVMVLLIRFIKEECLSDIPECALPPGLQGILLGGTPPGPDWGYPRGGHGQEHISMCPRPGHDPHFRCCSRVTMAAGRGRGRPDSNGDRCESSSPITGASVTILMPLTPVSTAVGWTRSACPGMVTAVAGENGTNPGMDPPPPYETLQDPPDYNSVMMDNNQA